MQNLSSLIVSSKTPIIEAMSKIDANAHGIVFVCSDDGVVLGSLTDGDVRRHIISGKRLDAPSLDAANESYYYITTDEESRNAQRICIERTLSALPRLDENRRLVSVHFRYETKVGTKPRIDIPVVIMAGGKGTRLLPYTKVLPKPLVPIGDTTITERIMSNFAEYGCCDIHMIVNYKKNMIKAYFADEHPDISIKFVDEDIPLGTGGGLKLLEGIVKNTFFLSNCDILINADYDEIYRTHMEARNIITMVCATKTVTIPYGIIEVDKDGKIFSLTEKPTFPFLTNTGLYVIEPAFLRYIENMKFTPITDIIQACIDVGERVGVYPISDDQWSDMGQLDEMEKMQKSLE